MSANKTPVSPLTQELRLATTMTGGVSLAIWMGGVTRELNLLSQSSRWRQAQGEPPADGPLTIATVKAMGLYGSLIDLLDVLVEEDVLSGTSAGGINAVLLAYARVNGRDLASLRDLWMDLGALTDLLREPTDKVVPSLMYGDERMFAELDENLPRLIDAQLPGLADGPPSTTLYVTTTLLSGETSRFTDSFGTLVQDVNRRGLFTFDEDQIGERANSSALALAARSTASFPGAFEPSFLPYTASTPKVGATPARPPMDPFMDITRAHWVADGGLLDNEPLDVLLQRIFERPAHRAVRRVLLYVVPSAGPQTSAPVEPADAGKPLGMLDGLMKDLSAVTSQSISASLRAVRDQNDRMAARIDMRLQLAAMAARIPSGERLLTKDVLTSYERQTAANEAGKLVPPLLKVLTTWQASSGAKNGTSNPLVPDAWRVELAVGGDADTKCRNAVVTTMIAQWSPPEPSALPADFAGLTRYGLVAFDTAKSILLDILRGAYVIAASDDDRLPLMDLLQSVHDAQPPKRVDLDELAREVCSDPTVLAGSLESAAAALARRYADETALVRDAWHDLAEVVTTHALQVIATNPVPVPAGAVTAGSVADQQRIARQTVQTYLGYLKPREGTELTAQRLFDLATTQRAMLPVDIGPEQAVELVQLSADTRCRLAPERSTAQDKLTGMQFHHFGAFYKRSWRANDWMWGRLDACGWLVHILLEPARVQAIADRPSSVRNAGESKAQWFLRRLRETFEPERASAGTAALQDAADAPLLDELKYLDDPTEVAPKSLSETAMWLAQAWQRVVADEELPIVANAIQSSSASDKSPDWSPSRSRAWAAKVTEQKQDLAVLLAACPVPDETLATDTGSPLMIRSLAKAAATTSAALNSVEQLPGVLRPAMTTTHTVTLGGYRVVKAVRGVARLVILIGLVLLTVGVALALQSATAFGITGLIAAGAGGYLIVFGTWQLSTRLLGALMGFTLTAAVASLAAPVVRSGLFGKSPADSGVVGRHVYWLGTSWWHPLLVIALLAMVMVAYSVLASKWFGRLALKLQRPKVRPLAASAPLPVASGSEAHKVTGHRAHLGVPAFARLSPRRRVS